MPLKAIENDLNMNAKIVGLIRANDHKTLTDLYKKTYPMVEKYILTNSGTIEDSKDIFQDAFYLLIKKSQEPDFQFTAQPSTFLFGISKNLWLKVLTKKHFDKDELIRESQFETMDDLESQDIQILNRVTKMKDCILALGEPCKTIIEQFYFLQASMKAIAEMLHYSNPDHAKNQKYKCFVRLKKMISIRDEE